LRIVPFVVTILALQIPIQHVDGLAGGLLEADTVDDIVVKITSRPSPSPAVAAVTGNLATGFPGA